MKTNLRCISPTKTPRNYPLRNVKEFSMIKVKNRFFKKNFPAIVTECNDFDYSLRNAPSINLSKQNILKFILLGPIKFLTITTYMF